MGVNQAGNSMLVILLCPRQAGSVGSLELGDPSVMMLFTLRAQAALRCPHFAAGHRLSAPSHSCPEE